MRLTTLLLLPLGALVSVPLTADPLFFSTGDTDGKIATASRPSSTGKIEIETGDDFLLKSETLINEATFTGLITGGDVANIGEVRVEIYRVFPNDSNTGRTSGPPTFSTSEVPTRVNSPSDVEFVDRDTAALNLTFTTTVLANTFTAGNSVLNGINPKFANLTGGEGPITGEEVLFDAHFATPFDLPAGHYFFIPQVEIQLANGEFMWLSAPKPITGGTGPFLPDLQTWIRNENLAPDWLRVGTDIVGGTAFNASFSLNGETVPEPASYILLGSALLAVAMAGRKRLRKG